MGMPNLVHKIDEKTPKGWWKGGMIKQTKSQTLALGPSQDLKCAWCESKATSKMMLEKEWSCNLFKLLY
jgi:hypothetical protein